MTTAESCELPWTLTQCLQAALHVLHFKLCHFIAISCRNCLCNAIKNDWDITRPALLLCAGLVIVLSTGSYGAFTDVGACSLRCRMN